MKKSLKGNTLETSLEINFYSLESKVFLQKGENIYIGKQLVNNTMRSILRDQAEYIKTSNFYEILDATIINEAANLALIQSANYDHVQYAKALHYWNSIFKKMIIGLSK